PSGPARLRILGATWGGIIVTAELQGMITVETFEALTLNMHTIHTKLLPDPAIGTIKTLVVLYQYDDGDGEMRLLNATQFAPHITVKITPTAHLDEEAKVLFDPVGGDGVEGGQGGGGQQQVEIVAVLYGTGRIQTPSVLEELIGYFEGRRGQIRLTDGFFRTNTWVGVKKSWTVFFRLRGVAGVSDKVRCVTGVENGALEVPWWRD
ncbi:hypothetical protein B0T17DRAFT_466405, partial [Bombardia bombarda]